MYDAAVHRKATLKRFSDVSLPGLRSVVTEDDMNTFNVPFDYFGKYVQHVNAPGIIQKVILLLDENAFEAALQWKKKTFPEKEADYPILVHFQDHKMTDALENHVKEKKLDLLYTHEDFPHFPWSIKHYYEVVQKKGFYTEDVGYQGGMVSKKFQGRFGDEQLSSFALKEDFEFTYSCIDATPPYGGKEDMEIRRKNFKENFLDNYEAGASFLWLE